MPTDEYKNHPLYDDWHDFKYYTDSVTTARLSYVDGETNDVPCVKVFMSKSATQTETEAMYEKASERGLIPHTTGFEESDEHIFVADE